MIQDFLLRIWQNLKTNFHKNGGWKSKKNFLMMFLFLWALHTFLRERGWLPKKSVRGKHIFITGAGSGLGRMMAIKFARLGAKLTISDINLEGIEETKRLIKCEVGTDQNVNGQKLDVSSREAITEIANQCRSVFGDVDILINNAGVVQGKVVQEMNEKLAGKVMIINAECHFWLTREFIQPMMAKRKGHVVSISSVAGLAGSAGLSDYSASKFAAYGFQESLRVEMKYLKKNVKCTTICPFYFNTGMFEGAKCSLIYPMLE
jgi:all-trans-retinol dehydrogenase (NAD+)